MSKKIHTVRPRVGEIVTVKVRHKSSILPGLYPVKDEGFLLFTGEVRPSEPWDFYDSIRITGNSDMPVRVISTKAILTWNGKKAFILSTNPDPSSKVSELIERKVVGSKGDVYTVTIHPDGFVTCNCKGFSFRSRCRHVEEVADES